MDAMGTRRGQERAWLVFAHSDAENALLVSHFDTDFFHVFEHLCLVAENQIRPVFLQPHFQLDEIDVLVLGCMFLERSPQSARRAR